MDAIFLVGGTPWINLCNTIANHHKKRTDFLDYPHVVKRWLEDNQLLLADGRKKLEGQETWDEMSSKLHELRIISRRAMLDIKEMGSLSNSLMASLQKLLDEVTIRSKLVNKEDKWEIKIEGTSPIDHVTYLIVQSILDTVYFVSPNRIRECEHEECILLFVDTSKSGRRKWCSMDTCGNRKKAADFYAKKNSMKGKNMGIACIGAIG